MASHADGTTIIFWDVKTGDVVKTFEGEADRILRVAFSPDGAIIATGGHGVKLWDVQLANVSGSGKPTIARSGQLPLARMAGG
ncbi:hypothetical protein HJG54_32720 [Leptolyngbya sp. NK1-12]|uniref:WD40 repeat domain-containing protein n=1 Tax=Leptolyngbya sp. NK1-12 TaxID=2547451 RepID=A0AA96WQR5_9CYAN|nr:hypothetical protein HJG54_32720 [Leptolyngbya sp. NK1-12]